MFAAARAVLFDFDGTLVAPSIDFDEMRRAVLAVLADYGLDPAPYVEMHVLELVRRAKQVMTAEQAARLEADAQAAILRIELEAADRVQVYPGVPAMLDELARRGLRVGIVTRNCRPAVERILARTPMRHEVLITRDDTEHVKPDPRHLEAALAPMGVPGHRAIMCGDHVMDVIAGQRLGAMTVGVLAPDLPPDYFDQVAPDLVLRDVTQITHYLPDMADVAARAAASVARLPGSGKVDHD